MSRGGDPMSRRVSPIALLSPRSIAGPADPVTPAPPQTAALA